MTVGINLRYLVWKMTVGIILRNLVWKIVGGGGELPKLVFFCAKSIQNQKQWDNFYSQNIQKLKYKFFFYWENFFFDSAYFFFSIFFQRYMVNLREAMRFKKTRKDILLSHDDSYDLNNYPESLRAHLIFILCLLEKIWIFSTIFTKGTTFYFAPTVNTFFLYWFWMVSRYVPPQRNQKHPKHPYQHLTVTYVELVECLNSNTSST